MRLDVQHIRQLVHDDVHGIVTPAVREEERSATLAELEQVVPRSVHAGRKRWPNHRVWQR